MQVSLHRRLDVLIATEEVCLIVPQRLRSLRTLRLDRDGREQRGWVPVSGGCNGGANPLSELDHALAMIGSAQWIENFSTSAHPRNRRQSTSLKWQLWGRGRV